MTIEQILKAYKDLSEDDKKKFKQSIEDRIDESVGEQEHLDGDKDSQTAKDRVAESLGEEKSLAEKGEAKTPEATVAKAVDEAKDAHEEKDAAKMDELFKRLDEISAKVDALAKQPEEANKSEADKLDKLTSKWQ